jgi:serine/threonine protein phosphatase PrpC
MDRLGLTTKLVHHVRTPFLELATATMANKEMRYNGASFTGYIHNERSGVKAAYAGVVDPLHSQRIGDAVRYGPSSGSFRYPDVPPSREEVAETHKMASILAKSLEYQLQTHSTQSARTAFKASDLVTQGLVADAKLLEKTTAEIAERRGCRAGWFVARDIRSDDPLDAQLQLKLKSLRKTGGGAGSAPAIAPDVLPATSARYSDEENESLAREVVMRGARLLPPLEVELHAANVGDCRAFGILCRGRKPGGREPDDPGYYRESFDLRYARDLGTELPGWHGGESTDALPPETRAKIQARTVPPVHTATPPLPSATQAPEALHEDGEEAGLKGDFYEAPEARRGRGPIDPDYDINKSLSFYSQELRHRERRKRLVPLSVDMKPSRLEEGKRVMNAGGGVDLQRHAMALHPPPVDEKGFLPKGFEPATSLPDDTPAIPVSRAFGFHRLKQNRFLGATHQQISPAPDVKTWTMRAGDLFVMASHALFETRSGEPTTVDSICDVVLEAVARRGISSAASGEEADGVCIDIASDLCDYAVRFGSPRNITVTVARCRDMVAVPRTMDDLEKDETIAKKLEAYSTFFVHDTTVVPGALYPGALRGSKAYRSLVAADTERMGISLRDLLMRRYVFVAPRLRDLGVTVAAVSIRDLVRRFPAEAGLLSAVMADEADFFRDCPFAPEEIDVQAPTNEQQAYFDKLVKFIENPSAVA